MSLNSQFSRQITTRFSRTLVAIVVVFALAGILFAQTTISTGSIQGTVTDPSGAVVSGAKVTITNKATGQTVNLTSSSSGAYSSGGLLPGNYVLRVENKGFQTSELPVVVQVGTTSLQEVDKMLAQQRVRVHVRLQSSAYLKSATQYLSARPAPSSRWSPHRHG